MTVQLDHTAIHSHDKRETARHLVAVHGRVRDPGLDRWVDPLHHRPRGDRHRRRRALAVPERPQRAQPGYSPSPKEHPEMTIENVPAVIDRATFEAELADLRIREKAHPGRRRDRRSPPPAARGRGRRRDHADRARRPDPLPDPSARHHRRADDGVHAGHGPGRAGSGDGGGGGVHTDLNEAGAFVTAGGLEPPSTAITVETTSTGPTRTAEPFVKADQYVGGFSIVEAADQEAALVWAEQASAALQSRIEVRALQSAPE